MSGIDRGRRVNLTFVFLMNLSRSLFFRIPLTVVFAWVAVSFAPGRSQETGAGTPEDQLRVRVSSPGQEPRRPMRFQFVVGAPMVSKTEVTMKMGGNMGAAGQMPAMALPKVSSISEIEVIGVGPDRSAEVSARLGQLRLGDGLLIGGAGEQNPLESLMPGFNEDLRWSYRQTARGMVFDFSAKLPAGVDPGLGQQLKQIQSGVQDASVVFPEEALGRGAKWEVTFPESDTRGVVTRKTVIYSLKEFNDAGATVEVGLRENAGDQKVGNLPGLPAGMSARLESLKLVASGEIRVQWASPVPNGYLSGRSEQVVHLNAGPELGGQPIEMAVNLDLETRFSTVDSPEARESSGLPARPSQINLAEYVNTQFSSMVRTDEGSYEFESPLKTGDGVEFEVAGLVQLAGMGAPGTTGRLPDRVSGIKLERKCQRISFLHAAGPGGRASDGTRIGSYVVRYADGETIEIPIVYGEDLRSWWVFPGEPPEAAHASVSWTTQSAGTPVRLFSRVWENPNPNRSIASVDVVGRMARQGLFLAGITAE